MLVLSNSKLNKKKRFHLNKLVINLNAIYSKQWLHHKKKNESKHRMPFGIPNNCNKFDISQ